MEGGVWRAVCGGRCVEAARMGPGWGGVRWGADLLVLSEAQDGLEHAAVEDLLEKLVRERAPGSWWIMVDHGGSWCTRWRVHLEPNALCLSVMFSLVWESKAGFSTRQLTKTLQVSGRQVSAQAGSEW